MYRFFTFSQGYDQRSHLDVEDADCSMVGLVHAHVYHCSFKYQNFTEAEMIYG